MKAVILAAGIGKRLQPLTCDKPKCLIKVGEKTILEHQLDNLCHAGIKNEDIIIVVGFRAENIEKVVGSSIKIVFNPKYETTNSLYSLWLAKSAVCRDGFILLNSDVLFHQEILFKLLNVKKNVLAVDFRKELQDGEMNIIVNRSKIIQINKEITAEDADGESVQIAKFNRSGSMIIFQAAQEFIKRGIVNEFPASLYKILIQKVGLFALDISGLPWIEIDSLEDLNRARAMSW